MLKIGDKAPVFTGMTGDGKQWKLEDALYEISYKNF